MIKLDLAELKRPIQTLSERDNCGDATLIIENEDSLFLAVFDGSGHGFSAQRTANRAITFLKENAHQELVDLLLALHKKLQGTVGGVCGLCRINKADAHMVCSGIGNISITLWGSSIKNFTLRGGIIGNEIVTPILEQSILEPKHVLMMYSDGIDGNLRSNDFPDFLNLSAGEIARISIDYFSKPLDDAAIIVAKVQND